MTEGEREKIKPREGRCEEWAGRPCAEERAGLRPWCVARSSPGWRGPRPVAGEPCVAGGTPSGGPSWQVCEALQAAAGSRGRVGQRVVGWRLGVRDLDHWGGVPRALFSVVAPAECAK